MQQTTLFFKSNGKKIQKIADHRPDTFFYSFARRRKFLKRSTNTKESPNTTAWGGWGSFHCRFYTTQTDTDSPPLFSVSLTHSLRRSEQVRNGAKRQQRGWEDKQTCHMHRDTVTDTRCRLHRSLQTRCPSAHAACPGPGRGRDPFPPPLRCRPGKREEQSALPSPHPPTAAAAMSLMETRAPRVQMSYNFLQ